MNYAFETASKAFDLAENEDEFHRIAKAVQILSSKPGIYGMIGGQVVDVEREGQPLTKSVLDFIHELKTSALIECSMMIGAVLAGADDADVNKVEKMAKNIGISFQIQDDILDVIGDAGKLGKATGVDKNKNTFVRLYGVETCKEMVARETEKAVHALDSFDNADFLIGLARELVHREF